MQDCEKLHITRGSLRGAVRLEFATSLTHALSSQETATRLWVNAQLNHECVRKFGADRHHSEEKRMAFGDFRGRGNPRCCVRSYKNLGLIGAGTSMFLWSMICPLNEMISILVTLLHVFQLELQTPSSQCLFCNTKCISPWINNMTDSWTGVSQTGSFSMFSYRFAPAVKEESAGRCRVAAVSPV